MTTVIIAGTLHQGTKNLTESLAFRLTQDSGHGRRSAFLILAHRYLPDLLFGHRQNTTKELPFLAIAIASRIQIHWNQQKNTNIVVAMVDQQTRVELASKLNALVDIPLIGEDQEQDMALKLIDMCVGPVEEAAPAKIEMAEMTRSTSRGVMENMVTSKIVKAINGRIDVPFVNEEQEERAITLIVCFLMRQKFDEAEALADEIDEQEKMKEDNFCAMATKSCAIM